jgi:hypothetical protein
MKLVHDIFNLSAVIGGKRDNFNRQVVPKKDESNLCCNLNFSSAMI